MTNSSLATALRSSPSPIYYAHLSSISPMIVRLLVQFLVNALCSLLLGFVLYPYPFVNNRTAIWLLRCLFFLLGLSVGYNIHAIINARVELAIRW